MTEKKAGPERDNSSIRDKKEDLKKLTVQGDTYHTTYNKKYENRKKWIKPNKNEVISVIPGTIREVLVKEGDKVSLSDKLLVLEAMKMMNTIYAPVKGKIKSLRVSVGDCIPKGTLMIEIE
jgi:biotin carboxyl carrier protein